jgi:hypothetical protein
MPCAFLRKTCNNNGEYADMDKNMTLEKRIAAELYCYQGKMSVFVDDLQGHTVEVGADEEFETASTIKAFLLAALYLQVQRGRASLTAELTYEQSQFVDGSGMLRALGGRKAQGEGHRYHDDHLLGQHRHQYDHRLSGTGYHQRLHPGAGLCAYCAAQSAAL